MDDTQWFCALEGRQQGPFDVQSLRALAARGGLSPDTLVWAEGMADWQPLRATPLAAMLAGAASAPPPAMGGMAMPSAAMPSSAMPLGGAAPANVGFVDAIRICLGKYVDFNGRANRPEYWYFYLFALLFVFAIAFLEGLFGIPGFLSTIATLGLTLPYIAAGVRRLHDTDRSGWWYLIGFVPFIGFLVLIVFWCQRGTQGRNRFG